LTGKRKAAALRQLSEMRDAATEALKKVEGEGIVEAEKITLNAESEPIEAPEKLKVRDDDVKPIEASEVIGKAEMEIPPQVELGPIEVVNEAEARAVGFVDTVGTVLNAEPETSETFRKNELTADLAMKPELEIGEFNNKMNNEEGDSSETSLLNSMATAEAAVMLPRFPDWLRFDDAAKANARSLLISEVAVARVRTQMLTELEGAAHEGTEDKASADSPESLLCRLSDEVDAKLDSSNHWECLEDTIEAEIQEV
jgi:hypothetical protein